MKATIEKDFFEVNETTYILTLMATGVIRNGNNVRDDTQFRVDLRGSRGSVILPMRVIGRFENEVDARAAMRAEKARMLKVSDT